MYLSLSSSKEVRSSNPQIWSQGGAILTYFYLVVKGSIVRLKRLSHITNVKTYNRSFNDLQGILKKGKRRVKILICVPFSERERDLILDNWSDYFQRELSLEQRRAVCHNLIELLPKNVQFPFAPILCLPSSFTISNFVKTCPLQISIPIVLTKIALSQK